MEKVKIYTTRGTAIEGEHYDEDTIVNVPKDVAAVVVGAGAALYVLDEKVARERASTAAAVKKAKAAADKSKDERPPKGP